MTLPPRAAGAPPRAIARPISPRARSGSPTSRTVENLQKIYGYYSTGACGTRSPISSPTTARSRWAQRGVYVGKARVREFLNLLGPVGLKDGELNDHVQLQVVVDVAPDGRTREGAQPRAQHDRRLREPRRVERRHLREHVRQGQRRLEDQGSALLPDVHLRLRQGLGRATRSPCRRRAPSCRPIARRRASTRSIPKAHIPPFHYDNPASGAEPRYPRSARPAERCRDRRRARARRRCRARRAAASRSTTSKRCVAQAEQQVARVKDFHEIDNLDERLRLLPRQESLERSRESVRRERLDRARAARRRTSAASACARSCSTCSARKARRENRLGNHIQYQPVIHVAPTTAQTAKVRSRMMQQLNFGPRASMGASLYENEFVKENGVWKFSIDHTFNTWTAGYDGGWVRNPGPRVPGPSRTFPPDTPPTFTFQMFPTVYEIPFHYPHPVTGRRRARGRIHEHARCRILHERSDADRTAAIGDARRIATEPEPCAPSRMPPEIAAELRSIGARIETQRTAELYAPLQPKEPYAWLAVTRDLKYGPHERNVLDVFTTQPRRRQARRGKPVIVFVHGGGFARGAEAHRRHAVLRQHRPVGRRRRARRRHAELSARAAEHVAVRHRGSHGGRRVAQGQRRAVRRRSEQDRALGAFRGRRARRGLRRERRQAQRSTPASPAPC